MACNFGGNVIFHITELSLYVYICALVIILQQRGRIVGKWVKFEEILKILQVTLLPTTYEQVCLTILLSTVLYQPFISYQSDKEKSQMSY